MGHPARALVVRRTTLGVREALRSLRAELAIQRRHRASMKRAAEVAARHPELRLHLGCGPNVKQGWVNIDLDDRADLQLDVREPLPFTDGSVAKVYSEHFLEHLAYPGELERVLAEIRRVLRPGGVISTGVPRVENALRDYVNGETTWFDNVRSQGQHPTWCTTRIDNVNYVFHQAGEHKYAYDLETLTRRLTDAGFVDVHERAFDPDLDDPKRPGTLYVDAIKPS